MKTCVTLLRLYLVIVWSMLGTSGINKSSFDIDQQFKKTSMNELKVLSRWLEEEDRDVVPLFSQCPPPIRPLSLSLCDASSCTNDQQCTSKKNNTYICCFNGCVKTCLRAVDPPPVIDWVEEPPKFKQYIVPSREEHSSAPEVVALQGGCLVTPTQYNRLQTFKSSKHISECFCAVGGVFCEVSKL